MRAEQARDDNGMITKEVWPCGRFYVNGNDSLQFRGSLEPGRKQPSPDLSVRTCLRKKKKKRGENGGKKIPNLPPRTSFSFVVVFLQVQVASCLPVDGGSCGNELCSAEACTAGRTWVDLTGSYKVQDVKDLPWLESLRKTVLKTAQLIVSGQHSYFEGDSVISCVFLL